MNNVESAMTLDLFSWAKNGRHHTVHLFHYLMAAGVVFERCSYFDTRCGCDILFTFEGAEYILTGGCGGTLDFHSTDKALNRRWSMRPDPPNVETVLYRMLARLHGEKIDYDHVAEGQPLIWHHFGMPWPNEWMPPPTAMPWVQELDHPHFNPQSMKRRVLLDRGQDKEGNNEEGNTR